jgi:uncharacterized membrane protein YphA (DoxX/SURF4 family)
MRHAWQSGMDTRDDRQLEVLRWTYGLVPIAAGADKFTNLLTQWGKYLSPTARDMLPVSTRTFMRAVGLIEIAAGALVLNRKTSRIGAYVVGGWLGAIAANLILDRKYDIAVRDIAMGIGAISLGRFLARQVERRTAERERTPRMPAVSPGARQGSDTEYALH